MKVLRGSYRTWEPSSAPTAVTIGVLDGVHHGHRSLISNLDPSLIKTVLTFHPHPIEVLRPGTHPRLLTTIEERLELLEKVGVELTGVLDLSEIKDLEPTTFVEEVLVDLLSMAQVVAGPDFRFGKDRSGDTDLLARLGVIHGFEVKQIGLVTDGDSVVSSSLIRQMVERGDMKGAADALGSRFRITGEVIGGERRGREIGFPTANIEPPDRKVIPGVGVYAGRARVAGSWHAAAINVGVRPTFGEGGLVIEAYLLDFDGDLYGRDMTLEFASFLRPELKFDTVDELISRIDDDVSETRALIGASELNEG